LALLYIFLALAALLLLFTLQLLPEMSLRDKAELLRELVNSRNFELVGSGLNMAFIPVLAYQVASSPPRAQYQSRRRPIR
jgi:hypothetical protein